MSQRRLAVDALLSMGRQGAQFVLLFLLTPFVVTQLGEDGYGMWTLALSTLGFLALMDLGLSLAVVRLVAGGGESKDQNERPRQLATTFFLFLGLAAVAAVITGLIAWWMPGNAGIPEAMQKDAGLLLLLLGIRHGVLLLPLGFFRGVLFGAQKFRLLNATQLSASLIQGAGTVVVLLAGGGLIGLAWLHLAVMLAEHLVYLWASYQHVPDLKLRWSLVDRKTLPRLFSFSGWTMLGSVAGLIMLRTDPLIIKTALPLAAVSVYGIALKITEALFMLLKQAINILSPVAAKLKGDGDMDGLRRTLLTSTKLAFACACMVAIPLAFVAEDFFVHWVGAEFASGGMVLSILAIVMIGSQPQIIASAFLSMTGHHKACGVLALSMAMTNLVLSLLLVGPLGLLGPALASLICVAIYDLIVAPVLLAKAFDQHLPTYYKQTLLPVLPSAAAAGLMTYTVRALFEPPNLFGVAVIGAIGVATFAAAYIATGQAPERIQRMFRRGSRAQTAPVRNQ